MELDVEEDPPRPRLAHSTSMYVDAEELSSATPGSSWLPLGPGGDEIYLLSPDSGAVPGMRIK